MASCSHGLATMAALRTQLCLHSKFPSSTPSPSSYRERSCQVSSFSSDCPASLSTREHQARSFNSARGRGEGRRRRRRSSNSGKNSTFTVCLASPFPPSSSPSSSTTSSSPSAWDGPRAPNAHVRKVATDGTQLIIDNNDDSDDGDAALLGGDRDTFPAAAGVMYAAGAPGYEDYDVSDEEDELLATTKEVAIRYKELRKLLKLLPPGVRKRLDGHPDLDDLVEVVLDLGRQPIARFPAGDEVLGNSPVTQQDLEFAIAKVGEFGEDNRAGIDRTLHRISALRNRRSKVIGLTCRVGRAIKGSAAMARDLVESGNSLLLMGRPGVGKTTAIREIARLLADEYGRRVVIVDTSNEIGGDGDIPHPGVGRARRMQVPSPDAQHHVMIEAVENHMPQVIVIDEIGTELECMAARTIAQRGVQLVATAHGNTLDNLIKNPSLQDLVGGIASVTLGDEEARRRGVQKSILERKAPPTFTCAVEMIDTKQWRVHTSVANTVDALLTGVTPRIEVRTLGEDNQISVRNEDWVPFEALDRGGQGKPARGSTSSYSSSSNGPTMDNNSSSGLTRGGVAPPPLQLFTYSISEEALEQVVDALGMGDAITITDDINSADAVLALRSRLKMNNWVREAARERQVPIYAIKANTMAQMVRALRTILGIDPSAGSAFGGSSAEQWQLVPRATAEDEIDALEEARLVVEQIVIPKGQPAELLPRAPAIMQLQKKLVEGYQLEWEACGNEPNCRLRILPSFAAQLPGGGGSGASGIEDGVTAGNSDALDKVYINLNGDSASGRV